METESKYLNEQELMDIGGAKRALVDGKAISRKGWNGKGMWLKIQWPSHLSDMSVPYVYMYTVQGEKVPWLCSQTDLLANDYFIVDTKSCPKL